MYIERDELQNKLEDIAKSESILKPLGGIVICIAIIMVAFTATSSSTLNNIGDALVGIFLFLFVTFSLEEEKKILSRIATYIKKCKRCFR